MLEGFSIESELASNGWWREFVAVETASARRVHLKNLGVQSSGDSASLTAQLDRFVQITRHPAIASLFSYKITPSNEVILITETVTTPGEMQVAAVIEAGIRLAGASSFLAANGVTETIISPEQIMQSSYGLPVLSGVGLRELAVFFSTQDSSQVSDKVAEIALTLQVLGAKSNPRSAALDALLAATVSDAAAGAHLSEFEFGRGLQAIQRDLGLPVTYLDAVESLEQTALVEKTSLIDRSTPHADANLDEATALAERTALVPKRVADDNTPLVERTAMVDRSQSFSPFAIEPEEEKTSLRAKKPSKQIEFPETVVSHSQARLAYDPGAQGVAKKRYESEPDPLSNLDTMPDTVQGGQPAQPLTLHRKEHFAPQSVRTKLLIFFAGSAIVVTGAVTALVFLLSAS